MRGNYSFSYLFARWIERCNLDENWRNTTGVDRAVAAMFRKGHRIFSKNMKQSKKQNQKSVDFGVSTPFFRQNRAIYAVDGTTEIVNGQCP